MTYYTFEKVELPVSKTASCSQCGKRLRRRTTLYQTLNPFNKNKLDGRLKTRAQIGEELREEAGRWKKQPVHCNPGFGCAV